MGTSILIFHVSGGSSAVAIASSVPASSLASSSTPSPCPTLLSLVTCQWASDSARNANFGASFKTLISRIDTTRRQVRPGRRYRSPGSGTGQRTEDTGRRTHGAGSVTGIRAEVDSERSRALQVLVQRMCAGRDLSLAGPSHQLATWPPTQAIHGLHMPGTASPAQVNSSIHLLWQCECVPGYIRLHWQVIFADLPLPGPLSTLPRAELLHPVGQGRFNAFAPAPASVTVPVRPALEKCISHLYKQHVACSISITVSVTR